MKLEDVRKLAEVAETKQCGFKSEYDSETKEWVKTTEPEFMDKYELEDIFLHGYTGTEKGSDLGKWLEEIKFNSVNQEGGGEGGSEYCSAVFTVEGKFYKGTYSYYSHNGYETDYFWDELKEVTPTEKTITVYS